MPQNGGTYTFTVKPEADLSTISSQVKTLSAEFQKLKLPKNMGENLAENTKKITDLIKKYQDQLAKGVNNKTDVKNLSEIEKEINRVFGHLMDDIKEVNNRPIILKVDAEKLEKLRTELKAAQDELKKGFEVRLGGDANSFNTLLNGIGRAKSLQGFAREAQDAFNTGDIEAYGTAIDKIINKVKGFQPQTLKSIIKSLFPDKDVKNISETKDLLDLIVPSLENIKTKGTDAIGATEGLRNVARETQEAFNNYETEALDRGKTAAEGTTKALEGQKQALQDVTHEENEAAKATANMKGQMDQLKSSTEYFFSLRNMFSLLRRGIHQAVETVRELDAAMTETAVVTDFSVSDMWSMLPEYTAQANKLGSTIKDVYDATTLYYQQGLDTNQAMGLANETLKMARIAGLEAAEATDAMTAALRGFNMEINETSAQRINDVYSEIAAKTASDTEELSTAMSKTASLAHSAGMTFEGTTAFLAQMIETTREAPENLGTAMKTIIARFQEMKKNPLEIVEVEGEEVNYNKIDEALQSIGVSLKDANGQFRDLDDVFLEISAKWDSLTQTQQRYIATTAAGSRQQSRFIAMMSNYERVTQLVEYANNSAGASQEQFEKTLDSFEAKVNRLKTAWQDYLMGIADNTIIKKGIDLLTDGLSQVNKLLDTLSSGLSKLGFNKEFSKSIISLGATFMGLKAGGKLINAAIGGFGGMIDPKSSFFKGFFGGGAIGRSTEQASAQAQQISNPIVQAIHQLQAAVTGKAAVTNSESPVNSTILDYKTAKSDLSSYLKKESNFSLTDIYGKIGNLSDNHQKAILQQLPGLKLSLGQGLSFNFKNRDISKGAQDLVNAFGKEVTDGLNNKTLSTNDVVKIFGTAENFQQAMAAKGDDYAKAAEEALYAGFSNASNRTDFIQALIESGMSEEDATQAAIEEAERNFKGFAGTAKTKGTDIANTIGGIGSAAVTAGQGIAQLGTQLSNAGFKEAGAMVTNLGYQISSLGQIASSAGSLIGKIAKKGGGSLIGGIGALVAAHPVITGILAVVTALGVAWGIHQKKVEEIHETAQKVKDDYAEINKSTTDNIATLQQYKDELASLKDGVDENGYNVSLSTDDYDRYLEIVDKIAEINPDIVKYYNAQGHAVLNLNNALEDTLELEEKRQKEALHTYTSQTSLQALLDDRAENKSWRDYSKGVTYYNDQGQPIKGDSLKGKTGAVVTKLQDAGFDLNKLQTKYGIDVDALLQGESKAIMQFTKNQSKILHEAESNLSTSWDTVGDGITEAFTDLGDAVKELNEINQPIFEQLATWIGQDTRFQNLDTEQKGFVTTGLQSIVMEDMDAPTMRKEARKVVREIDKQFGAGSQYENIMSRVKNAQEVFALDLDEQKYNKEIQGLISELEVLRDESENIGGAAGEALYNAYERQLALLQDQAGQSAHDIMEALNPLSDEIASAEGAFSKFEEVAKNDFSTASTNMKKFFDILNDDTHKAGYGDQSYWLAASEVFSEKALKGASKPSQVKALQNSISPLFEDGRTGFDNFINYINKFKDNDIVKKFLFNDKGQIQFNFDDENIHEIAEALKLSDNAFTALLNKARQFAHINFNNTDELREALALSDTSVLGKATTQGGEGNIYVNREQLLTDARASGSVTNPESEKQFWKDIKESGIIAIPGPDSLTAKQFEKWGAEYNKSFEEWKNSLKQDLNIREGKEGISDSIAVFDKMGYGKEDIYKYTQKLLGKDNVTAEDFNSLYNAYVEEQNLDPVTEGMSTIEATLETIASLIAGGDVAAGYLNSEQLQSKDLQKGTFGDDNVSDSMADYFVQGLNQLGQKLSKQEYEDNLQVLEGYRETANNYLNELYEGLKNVNPYDKEKVQLYEDEISNVRKYIQKVDDTINTGTKKLNEKNVQESKEQYSGYNNTINKRIEAELDITAETNFSEARGDYVEYKEEVEKNPPVIKPSTIKPKTDTKEITRATDTATKGGDATIHIKGDNTDAKAKVQEPIDKAEKANPTMKVGLEVKERPLDNAIAKINRPRTLDIYPSFRGNWSKTINVKEAAHGLNNYISPTGFYAGSMARGSRGGTLGPKGKGGVTLTGEKGFEIAWLPSEQRSMILGAQGPQLIDLPSDAVVWNHEQSKKIAKQKGISIGSMADSDVTSDVISLGGGTSTSGSGKKKKKKKKSSKKKSKSKSSSKSSSKGEINNFSIEEVVRFNVDQKIATQTAAIEKRTKSIEKSLDKIGTTYGSIASDINKQVAGVKDLKTQNQALVDSYQRQLAALDKNYKQKVSWTDSKGNSQEKTVNLGDYIKKVGDSYQIDQAKIAKLGSPAEREAVFNAANSALSNLTSGLLNAKKAVDEAEQQLEDFRKQLQDTFYGWENELTKIYNLSQQIESLDLSSDRFSAEIDSTLALVGTQFLSVANAGKRLIEVQKQNASVLTQNIQKQAELIKARRDQLALDIDYADELKAYNNILSTNRAKASKGTLTEQDKIKQNAAYDALVAAQMPTRYATRTKMQDGSYQLDIDWSKLERDRTAGNITDKTYEAIKNGIDKMQESINEYNQSIIDGFNSLQEIAEQYNNYVETLADLEKEVADAIKDMALNQVARLESLNKSIVDAGKKILDQARKNLQNRRQSEDNAKTEADIAKKENRLAALRANTSGGNQVEIAQLQKEINEARQNYGRTLEDQLLSRLQTQSDEAAAQRQEQIDLAKQQIELNSLNGVYFQEADALLTNVDAHSSEIKDILTTTQEETTGKWGAQVWEQELEQKIGNAITAEAGIPQLASVIQSEGSALREALVSANASSTSVSGTQSASTASIASNPVIENKAPASTPKASSTPAKSTSSSSSKYPYGKASDTTGNIKKGQKGTQVKAIQYALKQLGYVNKKRKSIAVDGSFGPDTQYAVKNFQKKRGIKVTGVVNDKTRAKFRAMGYKTGGLADYTGPAWLDGTPSKPEMVLNAQDTKNFIALKDILAGVMHDISHMDSNETYNAPMEFNINVNVDKISNDYDVDKLANRLKKDIVKDMSYRNVTQVRKFR